MTKAELLNAISDDTEVHSSVVEKVLSGLGRITSKRLGEGGTVTIPGVVKLGTKHRAARIGRNPQTGQSLDIPAKTVVTAKAVSALAEHVDQAS